MQQSRKRATLQNIIITLLYQFVVIVFGFIIPRLFITTYGPQIHGLTSSITNIMSYVILLYAGLNTASVQSLYEPLGKGDYRRLNEVLNAINKYYIKTGYYFTIAVFIISFALPMIIKDLSGTTVFYMMLVMGLQSSITSFGISTNRVLLQADQKLYISNIFNIIMMLVRGIIQVILIKRFISPVIVQSISLFALFITIILQRSYVKREYPMLDSSIPADEKALSKRWSALVHEISSLVVNSTDILLLTIATGDMILVSIYSVYQLVFSNLYRLMTSVFSQGSVASFGNLMATSDIKSLRKNYNMYEFVYFGFITVVFSATAVLILPFVDLYTRGTTGIDYVDHKLAILFVIIGIANNLRVPGGMLINAAGHYKETQGRAVIEASINLSISIILVKSLGLYGLLIGTVASFIYRTTDIIFYSNKYILEQSAKTTIIRSVQVIIIASLTTLYFEYLYVIDIQSWIDWIITGIKVGIVSILLVFVSSLFLEREISRKIVSKILTKIRK